MKDREIIQTLERLFSDSTSLDYPFTEKFGEAIHKAIELLDKLKEYEDLEEQGLLLRLPVAVGDILYTNQRMKGWFFKMKDAPYRVQVKFIGINNDEEMGNGFFNVSFENNGYTMQFKFSDIGKTVFLTQSEAEEKLRELENKNEN